MRLWDSPGGPVTDCALNTRGPVLISGQGTRCRVLQLRVHIAPTERSCMPQRDLEQSHYKIHIFKKRDGVMGWAPVILNPMTGVLRRPRQRLKDENFRGQGMPEIASNQKQGQGFFPLKTLEGS